MNVARALVVAIALSGPAWSQVLPYRVLGEPVPAGSGTIDAAGDLDADGKIDLLTMAGVLLGDGHANFAAAPGAPLAGARASARVAHLNGDGLLDVVSVSTPGTARVDLNGGALAFTQVGGAFPTLTTAGGALLAISRLTPGDVNGDGLADLLAQTYTPVPSPVPFVAPPQLLINGGAGTFAVAPPANFFLGSMMTIAEDLADVDLDGDLDAVLSGATPGPTYMVAVMKGNGAGGFGGAVPVQTHGTVWLHAALGDFNADGYRDLAVTGFGFSPGVSVYPGSPLGFTAPSATSTLSISAYRLIPIDLDANGRDELLVGTAWGGTAKVFPVSSTGAIGAPTQTFAGVYVDQPSPGPDVVADYDQDGDRDLALTYLGRPALLMNDSAGSLVRIGGRLDGVTFLGSIQTGGDVDQDGDFDLVGWGPGPGVPATMTAINDGDGWFTPGSSSLTPGIVTPTTSWMLYWAMHAFDRDGDGDSDLYAARNPLAPPYMVATDVVFDCAGGAFTLAHSLANNGPVSAIRDLDADGDGDRDILLGRRLSPTLGTTVAPAMLLVPNLGAGGFGAPVEIGAKHATWDLEVADFDGDGTDDFFQTNAIDSPAADPCALCLRTGPASFAVHPQAAMTGYFSAAGDLNADGLVDVVLDKQVWFNAGTATFAAGPTLDPPIGSPPALVDADGDGDLDLVESPAAVRFNSGGANFGARVSESPYSPTAPLSSPPTSLVADLDRDGDLDLVGSDLQIHSSCRRQIAIGKRPRPGRPASLQLFGGPGSSFSLFASANTANLPYPPFGAVLIDPGAATLVHANAFPAAGVASIQSTLSLNPALAGLTLYWQMVDVTASRLSNRLKTTIGGY
jgi:hypothetical protein